MIIYNGIDISNKVQIQNVEIIDTAEGRADSIEVTFNDPRNDWKFWAPQKNDEIIVGKDIFNTGTMFIDELEESSMYYKIKGLSINHEAKTIKNKSWDHISLYELIAEKAKSYGYSYEMFGTKDWYYSRVEQKDIADFEFLSYRCKLEGYALKITNKKIVVYDERDLEKYPPVTEFTLSSQNDYKFIDTEVFAACELINSGFHYTYKIKDSGRKHRVNNIQVSSLAEAERFAKGLLRNLNKYEKSGWIKTKFMPEIAAGSTININGSGIMTGMCFCYKVIHDFVNNRTIIYLRKPLEGY